VDQQEGGWKRRQRRDDAGDHLEPNVAGHDQGAIDRAGERIDQECCSNDREGELAALEAVTEDSEEWSRQRDRDRIHRHGRDRDPARDTV
jgi:hypothetical protein